MNAEVLFAALAAIAIAVAAGLAIWQLASRRAFRRETERAQSDVRELTRRLRQIENEQQFTGRFLREFPGLTRELSSQRRYRDVPAVLARVLAQVFRAEDVVVALRNEVDGEATLVVAAVYPEGSRLRAGMRVPVTEGEIGFAAQTLRVMDRADLESERSREPRLDAPSVPDFIPELVAPLSLEDAKFGVVALSGIHHMPSQAKDVVRLVTHVGSLALHSLSAFLEVKSAADVDPLTGVFNKRVLTSKLGELLFDSEGRQEPLSVFLFDIDHFKVYNDSHGHLAGDDLLKELTRLVSAYVRTDDVFGRFGGEEFMVILSGRGESEALVVAEKIRQVIEGHDFLHADKQPLGRLTISGGVAIFSRDGKTSSDLVRAADEALYRAKQAGRNQVFTASTLAPSEQQSDS